MNHLYPSNTSEVCAVITTYRPDEGFPERVKRVCQQVGLTVILNDGHSDENIQKLDRLFGNFCKVILHHNPDNLGIATSLNIGVSIAKSKGFQWVLTLDDDSLISSNMLERLSKYLRAISGEKPVALIGMSYADIDKELPNKDLLKDLAAWSEKRGIITSGSLLSMKAYDAIGPFRDDFFIDSVDYDFCLRARKKGLRIIKVDELGFIHSLGHASSHNILGKKVKTYNYGEDRLYYQFRNTIVLAMEQMAHDPLYSLAVLNNDIKTLLRILMFENDKKQKVTTAFRGLLDGFCKRMGRRSLCANNDETPTPVKLL